MHWHDYWAHCRNGQMHFYLLRGLLAGNGIRLDTLIQAANAQGFMQYKNNPNQTGHPRVLALHNAQSTDPVLEKPNEIWLYRPQ